MLTAIRRTAPGGAAGGLLGARNPVAHAGQPVGDLLRAGHAADAPNAGRRVVPQRVQRLQVGQHLGQRKADDVGERPTKLGDEGGGDPLDSVPAGLVAPFARRDVGGDLGRLQRPDGDDGRHGALDAAVTETDRVGGHDLVPPPGQARQHGVPVGIVHGLAQDGAVDDHGRVRRQHGQPARGSRAVGDGVALGAGDAARVVAGRFARADALVDAGRQNFQRQSDPLEQLAPAG